MDPISVGMLFGEARSHNQLIHRISQMMDDRHYRIAYARIVEGLCLFVLCVILIVGLWPFHSPRNEVAWIKDQNGLHFGGYGSILSSGAFRANGSKEDVSCSLEIWLEPGLIDSTNTILAIDSSGDPTLPFSFQQDVGGLVMQRRIVDQQGNVRRPTFKVSGVFHEGARAFVTIVAGKQNTAVYVDGALAKVSPSFGMSSKDLTGRLVVADSTTSDSWSGQVLGLAIYQRQLTPAQVVQHYESWTKNLRPVIDSDEAPAALYLFNERIGELVHNQVDPTTDLTIPARYEVLHPQLLEPAWRDYHFGWPRWSYWKDVAINIAGFIPVGFCFLTYFSSVRQTTRPVAVVILLGFVLSLAIETSQRFLPTRDSDMTDVITNTLGTAIGVLIWRWSFAQALFTKASAHAVSLVQNLSRGKTDKSAGQSEKIEISA